MSCPLSLPQIVHAQLSLVDPQFSLHLLECFRDRYAGEVSRALRLLCYTVGLPGPVARHSPA